MNLKIKHLAFGILLSCVCGFSQDSIPKTPEAKTPIESSNKEINTIGIDSLIDGKKVITAEIKAELDSTALKHLEDNQFAAEIDQKWLEELYSNTLYDTIYKTVSELKYEPVDYPELPTDTLKARLKKLNARTPFNIEYNPSLESVIKSYLKHRRKSMEKLMSLSDYYFPLFEESLDNYDIPLEVKYLAIVESALKPRAKSRVGATGLWQFMFGTGKEYGLNVVVMLMNEVIQ